MSELIHTGSLRNGVRFGLLLSTSIAGLLAAGVIVTDEALAADPTGEQPSVWLEIGGQLERVTGQGSPFAPNFLTKYSNSVVLQPTTPIQAQNPPLFEFGENGRIVVQPKETDWQFAASVIYGRSSSFKHVDHQTSRVATKYTGYVTDLEKFADTKVKRQESHLLFDFSAGKDVGLGLFGKHGSSVISVGVRFAQFTAKENFRINARPDLLLQYKYPSHYASIHFLPDRRFHTYQATGVATRSFVGAGPSLSWTGSVPILGEQQSGQISFDWGANAAFLFGKQKADVQHHETGRYDHNVLAGYTTLYVNPIRGHNTDRSIVVPNIGGFVGPTWRIQNFKFSLGYRADLFFGAMDGGIDTRKSETPSFYGPFATISIGLGG